MAIVTIEKSFDFDYEFEIECSECGNTLDVVKQRYNTFYVEPCPLCIEAAKNNQ